MKRIIILISVFTIFSCSNEAKKDSKTIQDTLVTKDTTEKVAVVDVKKTLASAPRFGVKEADDFVQNAKKIFSEMKKAEEAQDMDKLMKLTSESNALNTQLETALLKLEPAQQAQLQEWFSTAASAIEQ